ncbi:beta-D-glucosyl crocetin beta-1,6-glucosyltransferase-like [Salvia miltiorrhiza]|uniref:beta-D-glucosyl crocetin beta-1,6-glucosyltransferase-like n=1 Tax=Salvia miltiorrhiza TaxID=226208 RepID=UPI0025ABBAAF|nr:beta-D-glucosyl crocetin beta-1,6-glucosyltransferase-like [Salvia miltiorrhiza]
MNSTKNQSPRILMFPWLGYGHITPYLELAKKLTIKGFYIYLCSTPATLSSIEKKITQNFSNSIELVSLLLEVSSELPAKFHTTNGLPPHLMVKLKEAFDKSVENFSAILKNLKPDLLIFDFLQPWAPLLAEAQKIPSVIFITSSSVMTSLMFHHFKNPDTDFPFKNIRFRDYESRFMDELLENARDCREREKGSIGVDKSCKIVLIKGFREIEGRYIDYVSALVGKRFVPVGPLVQEPSLDDGGSSEIFSWLDKKKARSTAFVSFGSEYFLSKADMDGIAHGLLLSKVNFIWVVRFQEGVVQNGFLQKKFPEGFLDKVGDRGKILEGWAPQTKILVHANVGGFVSHCGWNSVMESLKFGVPIIAVPMHLDQPINARLVEEIGVGKEVVRDRDGRLHAETVAAVINHVVVEDGGGDVRGKAAEMKAKLHSKGDQEIDQVAQELMSICSKSSTNIV